ncbi:MAG: hypothetical protein GY755_02865 [Chloroflexi bacterium]|nr:hypothetical protein [Chloroflexota bacterium]
MDEISNKIIIEKILAYIAFSIIAATPSVSWTYFFISLGISTVALVSGIYGNLKRNKELTLLHHLSIIMMLGVYALNLLDASIGLSWNLLRWFSLSILIVVTLPFINKRLSEFLYREQVAPQTIIGRMIIIVSLAIAPFAGVIGASFGSLGGNQGIFAVAGFLMSFATLGGVFFNFHRYATDQFRWIVRNK